jgi:uncharacterized protein
MKSGQALIDSGPIIALFDKKDSFHSKTIEFISSYTGSLITTWPVITESLHMLSFSHTIQVNLLEWIERGGIILVDLIDADISYIKNRIHKYSDIPMDLADATLMCIAERENIQKIVSIDSDFSIYKTQKGKFLKNLMPI